MSATAADPGSVVVRHGGLTRLVRRHGWTIGIYALLLALTLVWRTQTTVKWGPFDVQSLVIDALPLCFAACAQSIVIISGGIDLSVGSMMSLANVVSAKYMLHMSFDEALLFSIAVVAGAALLGALTGLTIVGHTRGRHHRHAGDAVRARRSGARRAAGAGGAHRRALSVSSRSTRCRRRGSRPPCFSCSEPSPSSGLTVRRSRLGLALYATGSNRGAAFLAGVDVRRSRVIAYAYSERLPRWRPRPHRGLRPG